MGLWNVQSLRGKEEELVGEFERAEMAIMGVTETKKKGKGCSTLNNGHCLIYGGVDEADRAKAGVAVLIHKNWIQHVKNWKIISERVIRIDVEMEQNEVRTILVAYGPSENDAKDVKEIFWEQIQDEIDTTAENVIIIGDLNGRVGTRKEKDEQIGPYGESTKNTNGQRIIDFCIMNDMRVCNTFFQHKAIHQYTRVRDSRNEQSIIDLVLVHNKNRNEIRDVRVKRGYEIGSDHFLVEIKIKIKNWKQHGVCKKNDEDSYKQESIKVYKLQLANVRKEYCEKLNEKIARINWREEYSIEVLWRTFRESIWETGKEICGVTNGRKIKATAWWNEDIKMEIGKKKHLWKKYLNNKNNSNYEEYKVQRKRVKEIIKEAKMRQWEEFGERMERDSSGNAKLLYRTLKNLRRGRNEKTKGIRDVNGNLLLTNARIMERWQEHFMEILDGDTREIEIENEGMELSVVRDYEEEITLEETRNAIQKLKNGKAAGHDSIKAELIKCLDGEGLLLLLKIINLCWNNGRIPRDWTVATILPIYKKGDRQVCSNYRGISLLPVVSKLYEIILERRLREIIEKTLDDNQCGFRPGRGTTDLIFTIRQLIEKTLQYNSKLLLCFVDLEKAFDTAPRDKIWEVLERRNVGIKLIQAIKSIYTCTRNSVRTHNESSSEFVTRNGVRQGGVLSPLLFVALMDEIARKCKERVKKTRVGVDKLQQVFMSEMIYADDLVIVARTEGDMQLNVNIWNESFKEFGMKVNSAKTELLVIKKEHVNVNISMNNEVIKQVTDFKYLGSKISARGELEPEIESRVASATRLYYALNNSFIRKREVSLKTKIRIFKTIYEPVLLYGGETWVLSARNRSKIQACEMRYLRAVAGVTRCDRIRNELIREQCNVKPTLERLEGMRLRWFGHMVRMKDNRKVKSVWKMGNDGKRNRGRPTKSWNDEIGGILAKKNMKWKQAERMAKDRKEWKRLVMSFTSTP